MMTLEEAIAKATKLIKLAKSSEPHEAALAAQRAQEILSRYNIDMAALAIDGDVSAPQEEIIDWGGTAPLERGKVKLAQWKLSLASRIARANQCRAYQQGGSWRGGPVIGLIGRQSDVQKIRYLYAMLVSEIDRLAKRDGKGKGATYLNQFRLGAVDAIGHKLAEAHAKVAAQMRREQTGTGLVRIDKALAQIDANKAAVDAWVKANTNMRSKSSASRYDGAARSAGYAAGQTVNVSGARAGLGAGQAKLR